MDRSLTLDIDIHIDHSLMNQVANQLMLAVVIQIWINHQNGLIINPTFIGNIALCHNSVQKHIGQMDNAACDIIHIFLYRLKQILIWGI